MSFDIFVFLVFLFLVGAYFVLGALFVDYVNRPKRQVNRSAKAGHYKFGQAFIL